MSVLHVSLGGLVQAATQAAVVLSLGTSVLVACGAGDDESRAPLEEGTCVQGSSELTCDYSNENDLHIYDLAPNFTPSSWCSGTIVPPNADGSKVSCESLGYPVRCSNCSGHYFWYAIGKVCATCGGSGEPGGEDDDCDNEGCIAACSQAGGTNCGQDCACP